MQPILQDRFLQHNACVLVPTYNNQNTLGQVLESILKYTDRILVVNDGSTDRTAEIISGYPGIQVVSYEKNVGKGWALRQGFKKAQEIGYDYAITIDSDGQHFAEDLPKFLDVVDNNPDVLVIGARNMEQSFVPGKSNVGNRISTFWFWVETGVKLTDTQSGYRLYPIRRMKQMKFQTMKFEFEIEVMARASWSGIPITSVPIKVFYAEKGSRVSHFRPFEDFSRVGVLHTVLTTIAIVYIRPRNLFLGIKKKTSDKSSSILFLILTSLLN
jgi:glycosyltransferase involved in cell wall biosynthesis